MCACCYFADNDDDDNHDDLGTITEFDASQNSCFLICEMNIASCVTNRALFNPDGEYDKLLGVTCTNVFVLNFVDRE